MYTKNLDFSRLLYESACHGLYKRIDACVISEYGGGFLAAC